MAPQQENKGTKRKNKSRYIAQSNPRRGAPAVLLTCETSREAKCRREGLEILKYYSEQFIPTEPSAKQEQTQSLEDELKALKNGKVSEKSPFSCFETGCKGTVLFLFDPKQESEEAADEHALHGKDESRLNNDDNDQRKRQRPDATLNEADNQQFDPLEMVGQILRDTKDNTSLQSSGMGIPGSRFVSRIIPLQATCSVSIKDLTTTVAKLAVRFIQSLSDEKKESIRTFAVQIKRRNCGHVKRMDMIEAVAGQVLKTAKELTGKDWSVDLTTPDVTVWVEVCKSICGISILLSEMLQVAPNWNVAEIRATSQSDADADNEE